GLLNDLSISTLFHPAQNRNFSPAGRSQTPITANHLTPPQSSLKRESYRHAFFLGGADAQARGKRGLTPSAQPKPKRRRLPQSAPPPDTGTESSAEWAFAAKRCAYF